MTERELAMLRAAIEALDVDVRARKGSRAAYIAIAHARGILDRVARRRQRT